ncbi:hypothetical protein, partial [Salmonella enterica]|uniref:hypothetical protein n=1 Tax=Salmonella enterica TaxID=28901 RepID=UPI003523D1B0
MQKQATPVIVPEAPFVATGIEEKAALDVGRVIVAPEDCVITVVDANKIVLKSAKKDHEFKLATFKKSNQFTVLHQRPSVILNQKIKRGDILADSST